MTVDLRSLFRDYMKRLNPTADPLEAISAGYYRHHPTAISRHIATRLELDVASSHLVVGGIGSGKTTELLAIQRALASVEDIRCVLVDVPARHRIDKSGPGVLLAIAAIEAAAQLNAVSSAETRSYELNTAIQNIQKLASGYWEHAEMHDEDDDAPYATVWVEGLLAAPSPSGPVQELVAALPHVLTALPTRFVLLLDGLDRLVDTSAFARLISEDVPAIVALGMGVVVVGPQHLRFRNERIVQDRFTSVHLHGASSLGTEEGLEFLVGVLRARIAPGVLPDDSCRALAQWSGGVLRDLIALARAAGEDAYSAGAALVGLEHVDSAADRFGRGLLLGITPEMAARLKEFIPQSARRFESAPRELKFTPATDTDIALLLERLIIEVPGTPIRYVPHPAIVPFVRGLHGS